MTHHKLTQLATRTCEHSGVCGCARKTPSKAVADYLARSKRRLPVAIAYNPRITANDYSDGCRWVDYPSNGLREVGPVHDLHTHDGHSVRVDHKGWFIDNDAMETVHGVVYQLPSRNGEQLYLAAVSDPYGNNSALIDFDTVSDLDDAVRRADSMAEQYAKDAREWDAKQQAEQRIEDIGEEIAEAREQRRAIVAGLRGVTVANVPALCAAVRAQIAQLKLQSKELHKERAKLQDNYWNVVHGY